MKPHCKWSKLQKLISDTYIIFVGGFKTLSMASGKKESEAFNMLKFMYQDDEDDLEDAERGEDEGGHEEEEPQVQKLQSGGEEFELKDLEQQESKGMDAVFPGELQDGTSLQQLDTGTLRFPTPQAEGLAVEPLRSRRERPTIVDYGHDEVAMSPEAEEGEILGNGRFNQDANSANADSQDRALAGDVGIIISTPTVHLTPPSVRVENSESDALNDVSKESIMDDLTGANIHEDIDPLDRFLPPPPKAKCPEDLQDKINKFLAYKRQGKSFNAEVRNRKDYRNPDFLLHAVRYQDIDQIGSCFSKDVFDPHGYDARDYYDAIEVDMKLEMERKEQEKKKSPKVEFVTSGTQQAVLLAATRSTMSVSGVPNLPSGGVQSTSVSAHAVSREGRQNKKSKWDKVDDDQKTALGGGQVAQTSVGAHASFMSAANAGSGYAMFVQQKRREAEEKRSSERKVDRRS